MDSTHENNKLIAEFMGYANKRPLTDSLLEKLYNDWNSIMPVVDKIDSLELDGDTFAVDIYQTGAQIFQYGNYNTELLTVDGANRMQATYKICVEFIKWYNEQPKN
jgi:hypothetical protein